MVVEMVMVVVVLVLVVVVVVEEEVAVVVEMVVVEMMMEAAIADNNSENDCPARKPIGVIAPVFRAPSPSVASFMKVTHDSLPQQQKQQPSHPAAGGGEADIYYDTDGPWLIDQLRKRGLSARPGLGLRHDVAHTQYEKTLMATPDLHHFQQAPNETTSKVFCVLSISCTLSMLCCTTIHGK